QLAIRQAFRNAYGGPMPPREIVDDTPKAHVTDVGRQYFDANAGRPARLSNEFAQTLESAFYVLDHIPDKSTYESRDADVRRALYEQIVFGDLANYFDSSSVYDFFPLRSRFPLRDIDVINSATGAGRMDLFRMFALGSSETRFTTLRLG